MEAASPGRVAPSGTRRGTRGRRRSAGERVERERARRADAEGLAAALRALPAGDGAGGLLRGARIGSGEVRQCAAVAASRRDALVARRLLDFCARGHKAGAPPLTAAAASDLLHALGAAEGHEGYDDGAADAAWRAFEWLAGLGGGARWLAVASAAEPPPLADLAPRAFTPVLLGAARADAWDRVTTALGSIADAGAGPPEAGAALELADLLVAADGAGGEGAIGCADDVFRGLVRAGAQVKPGTYVWAVWRESTRKGGSLSRALELRQLARAGGLKLNTRALRALLKLCAEEGDADEALRLTEEAAAEGLEPDARAVHYACKACARAERWADVRALFEGARDAGVEPAGAPDYAWYSRACCESGEPALAVGALDDLTARGLRANAVAYARVVDACAFAGEAELASRTLANMRAVGVRGDEGAYVGVMRACKERGDWAQALEVFELMRTDGIQPDVRVYTLLMGILRAADEHRSVLAVFRRAQADDVRLDAQAYTVLFASLLDGGRWRTVLRLYHSLELTGVEPNMRLLTTVLAACADGQQFPEANAVYDRMLAVSRWGGGAMDVHSYSAMLAVCDACGGYEDKARSVLNEMRADGVAPNMYSFAALMGCLARKAKWAEAHELLDEVRRETGEEPAEVVYDKLLRGLADHREWQPAMRLLAQMKNLGLNLQARSFNSLMRACVSSGEYDAAFSTFAQLQRAGLEPETQTYNLLMEVCEARGEWEDLLGVYSELKKAGLKPDVSSYELTVRAAKELGLVDSALEALAELRAGGADFALQPTSAVFVEALRACARRARGAAACEIVAQMKEDGVPLGRREYGTAIAACQFAGMWQDALRLYDELLDTGRRAKTASLYSLLFQACASGREWERALKLFHEMEESGVKVSFSAYNSLLGALWASGRWEETQEVLDAAIISGAFRNPVVPFLFEARHSRAAAFELGGLREGAACAFTLRWLLSLRRRDPDIFDGTFTLVLDQNPLAKKSMMAVSAVLERVGVPLSRPSWRSRLQGDTEQHLLQAEASELCAWLQGFTDDDLVQRALVPPEERLPRPSGRAEDAPLAPDGSFDVLSFYTFDENDMDEEDEEE